MAARRGSNKRRSSQAVRGKRTTWPAWLWMLVGVMLGLGLSALFIISDWGPSIAERDQPRPNPQAQAPAPAAIADEPAAPRSTGRRQPSYDFYTVLPEMEVVIPDAELSQRVRQREIATEPETTTTRYLLQAGSFRDARDADALKATLILLNFSPHVQTVNIDANTWHRVRLGPFSSAREVEEIKRTLASNGVEAMTLRESGG